ncbi:ABC transporter permease [Buchananella felis]|uniref:ABC transporter permease n=1 Tax=Buchananella felis TaxID=3231492 RepID=UPI00352870C8
MFFYLARRIVNYAILLLIAVTLAYFLAASQLEPRSLYELRNPPLDPVSIETSLRNYNLSDQVPIFERFVTWARGVVMHWDWGKSPFGGSVNEEIGRRVFVSLRLVVLGAFLGMGVGVALGAWTATRQYKVSDRVISIISLIIISTPAMVIAILLQVLAVRFNQTFDSQFFEFSGETGEIGDYPGAAIVDRLQHLLLPTISMSLGGIASYSRYQRNLMLDTLGADYVRTARAKGLRKGVAVRRHALRTALIPMGTYFAFAITSMVLGASITERVYAWHGMGIYGVESIQKHDVHGTVAVVAFSGTATLTGAFLSDVLVAIIDPRVRVS